MASDWTTFLKHVDDDSAPAEVIRAAEKVFLDAGITAPAAADGILWQDLAFEGVAPLVRALVRRALRALDSAVASKRRKLENGTEKMPASIAMASKELVDHRTRTIEVYTHGHHPIVVSQHAARTAANSAAFLLPLLEKGSRLLDVGCGPGSITVGLAQHVGPTGCVCAIDVAHGVVKQAEAAIADAGLPASQCSARTASVYEVASEFQHASFDCAYAHQTLQHLSDPVGAIREMMAVVRPGGILAFRDADYSSMLGMPMTPGLEEWRRIYRSVCHRNGAEPDAGRHLVRWLREAGVPLANISYTASVVVHSPADEEFRKAWGSAWSVRSTESAFAKQAVEYGLATQAELEAVANAWREFVDNRESIFYYVNGEVIARVPLARSDT